MAPHQLNPAGGRRCAGALLCLPIESSESHGIRGNVRVYQADSRQLGIAADEKFESDYLKRILASIAAKSPILANYVHKYMDDMYQHFSNVKKHLADHAKLHYVVGNSKFYDTLVSVEQLYADMMTAAGFADVQIEPIRKRNSKTELYEFLVSASSKA